jgi:hypothetical protein
MVVYSFNGKEECKNINELLNVLKQRSKGNSNDFELRTDQEYPFLTILVKDELACVHFFLNEEDCGHYAYTDNKVLNEDYIIFNIGSENSETKISKDLVISVEQAYIIAKDFYEKLEMSKKVKWFEL